MNRSPIMGKTLPILIYVLSCAGIGYFSFSHLSRHVATHPAPSAVGYEKLAVLLPFLAALITCLFWPFAIYAVSRLLFRTKQEHLFSPAVLALSTLAYVMTLRATGIFFAWARQQ